MKLTPKNAKALQEQGKSNKENNQQINDNNNSTSAQTKICGGCGIRFAPKITSHLLCICCWRWQRAGKSIRLTLSLIRGATVAPAKVG